MQESVSNQNNTKTPKENTLGNQNIDSEQNQEEKGDDGDSEQDESAVNKSKISIKAVFMVLPFVMLADFIDIFSPTGVGYFVALIYGWFIFVISSKVLKISLKDIFQNKRFWKNFGGNAFESIPFSPGFIIPARTAVFLWSAWEAFKQ